MAVTTQDLIDQANSYVGTDATRVVSDAERLTFITESVNWLQETLGNDHSVSTYTLPHLDTVYRYQVSDSLADLLTGADLSVPLGSDGGLFDSRTAREVANDINTGLVQNEWAIERENGEAYLIVNYASPRKALDIDTFSSLSSWVVDATTSDATNLTLDQYESLDGNSSLNFDIDVSQSVANSATIYNDSVSVELSSLEDTGVFVMNVYIPSVTYTSSVSLKWGTDASNYWLATVATDIDGGAFVAGWNKVALEWSQASTVGTPSSTIGYLAITVAYGASQADDTDYRVDYLRVAKATELKFSYLSWNVGTDSAGDSVTKFSAVTDIPYFSGVYDQYQFPVAHWAASLILSKMRQPTEAEEQRDLAIQGVSAKPKYIPSSRQRLAKSFKVGGISFNNRRRF